MIDLKKIKSELYQMDLGDFKLIQTKINSFLLINIRYKFSDCIYINVNKYNIEINYDRIFDRKGFYDGIEKLIIKSIVCGNPKSVTKAIKELINFHK